MKRSPIKRKRSKPRKMENLTLRARYSRGNPSCEIVVWLYDVFAEIAEAEGWTGQAEETHHIYGGTSGRNDLVSNIIRLSKRAHDWCGKNMVDGRIVCLWIKHQKHELDPEEVRTASGKFLPGILAGATVRFKFVEPLLAELRAAYP